MVVPIYKKGCIKRIYYGEVIRLFITFITFDLISKYFLHTKNLLLVLPIAMILLDGTDNIFTRLYSFKFGNYIHNVCTTLFEYQILDKINDLVTYFLAWHWFKLDLLFLVFTIWRAIGVIIFGLTRSALPLIAMPDFMKEYLLFKYFWPTKTYILAIIIIGKTIFEWVFHSKLKKINY